MDLPGYLDFANNLIGLSVWAGIFVLWLWRRTSNASKTTVENRQEGEENKKRGQKRGEERSEFRRFASGD